MFPLMLPIASAQEDQLIIASATWPQVAAGVWIGPRLPCIPFQDIFSSSQISQCTEPLLDTAFVRKSDQALGNNIRNSVPVFSVIRHSRDVCVGVEARSQSQSNSSSNCGGISSSLEVVRSTLSSSLCGSTASSRNTSSSISDSSETASNGIENNSYSAVQVESIPWVVKKKKPGRIPKPPTDRRPKPPTGTDAASRFHPCTYCPKVLDTRRHLQTHNSVVHNIVRKGHNCKLCPKSFSSNSYLIQHMRIHSQDRPFGPCEFCGKSFLQLAHLQQHLRTHTGEKPFKCDFPGCNKEFAQVSNLRNHSRYHEDEKTFGCRSCFKTFDKESLLFEHVRDHKHSKHRRVHVCLYCGKSYCLATYLKKHMESKHADVESNSPNADVEWQPNVSITTIEANFREVLRQ